MDEIDRNLIDAWDRITATCQRDRAEAVKRARRQWSATLSRPPRAWCLAIRAADTRLTEAFGVVAREDDVALGVEHDVLIDAAAIQRLCSPVWIKWPGVSLNEAAAMLGKHRESLRHWLPVRPGRTRKTRAEQLPTRWREVRDEGFPLNVRYECAASHGHFGIDVPIVWTDGEVDPGFVRGAVPHAVWGSMWRSLAERIPEDFVLEATRVPRWRPYGDGVRFRGWEWACPGRWVPIDSLSAAERELVEREASQSDQPERWMLADDDQMYARLGCGRRANVLYGPLPIFGIGSFLGGEGIALSPRDHADDFKATSVEGDALHMSGTWFPGQSDPLAGLRSFACSHCWRVRNFSLCDYRGWNEFVSYISGGLLYGNEVERPDSVKLVRKREPSKRERRERINNKREQGPSDRVAAGDRAANRVADRSQAV